MRIDQTGHPAPLAGARSTRRQSKTGFAMPTDPDEAPAQTSSQVGPPEMATAPAASEAIGLLLASEGEPQPLPADDAAASRQGSELLQAMAGLQRALLDGTGQAAQQSLADLARTLPKSADPALNAVLQAIAQRAAVERARTE